MVSRYSLSKRALDIVLSIFGLAVLSGLLILISILIRCTTNGPIFFRQQRTGKGGKLFEMIKFRTMTDETDGLGALSADCDRVTAIGHFLRLFSLDELPELWNVLKGEMSIVGPRPLLPEYLPLYTAEQARRHEVTPGITGWAQINGRNSISWEEKFERDVWYVDNCSFFLDLKIIWLTVGRVIRCDGVVASDNFNGSKYNVKNDG